MPRVSAIAATFAGLLVAAMSPARADDVAEFYKGKVITLTVSAGAGGGYDTLARTLARFLGKHVPGEPIVIVRNMAGGGGLAAANYIYSGVEKDGRQIGLLQSNLHAREAQPRDQAQLGILRMLRDRLQIFRRHGEVTGLHIRARRGKPGLVHVRRCGIVALELS